MSYYPKENIRFKCNDHKVRGMQVHYKSAEKYVGSDELELLVLFPAGFAWEVHYDVEVRETRAAVASCPISYVAR